MNNGKLVIVFYRGFVGIVNFFFKWRWVKDDISIVVVVVVVVVIIIIIIIIIIIGIIISSYSIFVIEVQCRDVLDWTDECANYKIYDNTYFFSSSLS